MAGSQYPNDDFDLEAELRRRTPELRAQREKAQRNLEQTTEFPQRVRQASAQVAAERVRLAKQAAELLKARGHPANHSERIVVSISGRRTIFGGHKIAVVYERQPTMVWWIYEGWYTPPPPESDPTGKNGPLERQGHALGEDGREFKITTRGLRKFEQPDLRATNDTELQTQINKRRKSDRSFFVSFVAEELGEVKKDDFWDK